jgi:hypothetical protein
VNWQWNLYYGTSASTGPLTQTDIKSLANSSLTSGFAGTYSFVAGGYKYISYPSLLGTATSFKDSSNNLDISMESPYTVSVTNVNGITTNYNVHRTTNSLGSSINIIVG